MSTEKLIIELEAKVSQAQKEIEGVRGALDDLGESTDKNDTKFKNFAGSAKTAGSAVATAAKAIIAAGIALTGFITIAAKAEQETAVLSRTAKTTREDFKELAFAFGTVGVDAKGAADAMNDVSERLGEFAAAGSGPFQDFADVMGMSTEQAQAFAEVLQREKPEDAIRAMVSEMEDAGVEGAQMSFVLKSMSGDLEYANELFRKNGEELDRLKGRYAEMEEQLGLTNEQAQDIQKAAEEFDIMTESMKMAATQVAADLAPEFLRFFSWITENVPIATNIVVDFINSFRDPENIKSVESLNRLMADNAEKIAEINEQIEKEKDLNWAKLLMRDRKELELQNQEYQEQIDALEELKKKRVELAEIGPKVALEDGLTAKEVSFTDGLADELAKAHEIEQEYMEIREERYKEHIERMISETDVFVDNVLAGFDDMDAQDAKLKDFREGRAKENTDNMIGIAKIAGETIFKDSKAFDAGVVVADTAVGVQRALTPPFPGAPPNFASAAFIAASGAAQLANVLSARKGGGTITGAAATSGGEIVSGQAENVSRVFVEGVNAGEFITRETAAEMLREQFENGARFEFL